MKTTKYYHKNSDVVAFSRVEFDNGNWCEFTYDERGNKLTYKESTGYWGQTTYDKEGRELTYKNSTGYFKIKGKKVTEEEFNNFHKTLKK